MNTIRNKFEKIKEKKLKELQGFLAFQKNIFQAWILDLSCIFIGIYLRMNKKSSLDQREISYRPHSISSSSERNNHNLRIDYPRHFPNTENIYSSLKFPSSQSIIVPQLQVTPKRNMNSYPSPYYETFYGAPPTKKIVFTFISPEDLQPQTRQIETHVRQNDKPVTNQWEARYYELSKQMENFMVNHDFITQQFLDLKKEIKSMNENSQSHLKSQEPSDEFKTTTFERNDDRKLRILEKKNEDMKRLISIYEEERKEQEQSEKETEFLLRKTLAEKDKKIIDLETEVNGAREKSENLSMQNKQLGGKIQQLKQEYEVLEDKLAETEANLVENKIKEIEAEKKLEHYFKIEKQVRRQIKEKDDFIDELRKQVSEGKVREEESMTSKEKFEKLYHEKRVQLENYKIIKDSALISSDENRFIAHYEQKISELTHIAKEKEQKIKKLREENKKLEKKIGEIGDNFISQQQLETLHNKIQKYENQLNNQGGVIYDKLNNKTYDYYNGKVFEESLIYELKKDNEKLMNMINRLRMGEQVVFTASFPTKHRFQKGNKTSDILMEMKKLLSDTFFKMEQVIREFTFPESEQSTPKNKSKIKVEILSPSRSSRKKQAYEKSERFKIGRELQLIKIYMLDLDNYWKKLTDVVLSQEKGKEKEMKKKIEKTEERLIISFSNEKERELLYYKNQNEKLTGRIEELLNMNNTMKNMLSKQSGTKATNDVYWKEEAKRLQEVNEALEENVKKIKVFLEKEEKQREKLEDRTSLIVVELERIKRKFSEEREKNEKNEKRLLELNSLNQVKAQMALQMDSLNLKYLQRNSDFEKQKQNTAQSHQQQIQELRSSMKILEAEISREREQKKILKNQILKYSLILEKENQQPLSRKQKQKNSQKPFIFQKIRSKLIETEILITQVVQIKSERNEKLNFEIRNNFTVIFDEFAKLYPQPSGNAKQQRNEYSLEYLRSIFLELEALLGEVTMKKEERPLSNQIYKRINHGLEVISLF